MSTPTERFREQLAALQRPPSTSQSEPIDLRPGNAYEAVTRQMVESLTDELREIRGRLNGLIFMMIGAIVLDIVTRIGGQ